MKYLLSHFRTNIINLMRIIIQLYDTIIYIMDLGTTELNSLPIGNNNTNNNTNNNNNNNNNNTNTEYTPLKVSGPPNPTMSQENINLFVTGIQQASQSGMTQLPIRDVPRNQDHLVQDKHIITDYIPENSNYDYIPRHTSNPNNITQDQFNKSKFENVYSEMFTPLLIAILFFLFSLPLFKTYVLKVFPGMIKSDGNFNLYGFLFNSLCFSASYYLITKWLIIADERII